MRKKSNPRKSLVEKGKVKTAIKPGKQTARNGWPILVLAATGIFLISMFIYFPALKNGFINTWDDGAYVVNNQLLHSISFQTVREMFTINSPLCKLINNYHPFTILSLAVNYQFARLSPSFYIFTNILLHAINAILVFFFIYQLSDRRMWAAVMAGLWFGIHPMHVESVAWVSERKDVLYAFFFLAGLIAYLEYLRKGKILLLVFCFVLFVCSVLSKAMAIPFPMVLFIIDYYKRRPASIKLILEKIPFLAIAVAFGIIAMRLQSPDAINNFRDFTLVQRTMHASYGFIIYIVKFIAPLPLSAFYPYPVPGDHGQLPLAFRAAPFLFIALLLFTVWSAIRRSNMARIWVTGFLFYLLMLLMVIQFVSVGKAIIAERYTYLPYIGLSFIAGMALSGLLSAGKPFKMIGVLAGVVMLLLSFYYIFATAKRTMVWKNDITLWTNVIDQYPDARSDFIYEKRAKTLVHNQDYENALRDYKIIIRNDPADENAYSNIGWICGQFLNQPDTALLYLEKGYEVNPKNIFILKGLGIAHGMKGHIPEALACLLAAYEQTPDDPSLLKNIAGSYFLLGENGKADEFNAKAIALVKGTGGQADKRTGGKADERTGGQK
jgi:protein O-mannosyl-transferase